MAKSHKIYYSMGQVCEIFDLPASTIRFWETRFTAFRPKKNAKGNRLFTADDVENLKLIYHLTKEKKMTLSGAEKFMMQKRVAAKGEMSLVEVLQKVKSTLLEIRQELETTEKPAQNEIMIKGEQVELEPVVEKIVEKIEQGTQAKIEESVEGEDPIIEQPIPQSEPAEPEKPKYIELTLF